MLTEEEKDDESDVEKDPKLQATSCQRRTSIDRIAAYSPFQKSRHGLESLNWQFEKSDAMVYPRLDVLWKGWLETHGWSP